MLKAKSSQLSFYGNHIYDWAIPKTHFLKLLDKVVDFSFVNELCRDAYIFFGFQFWFTSGVLVVYYTDIKGFISFLRGTIDRLKVPLLQR